MGRVNNFARLQRVPKSYLKPRFLWYLEELRARYENTVIRLTPVHVRCGHDGHGLATLARVVGDEAEGESAALRDDQVVTYVTLRDPTRLRGERVTRALPLARHVHHLPWPSSSNNPASPQNTQ